MSKTKEIFFNTIDTVENVNGNTKTDFVSIYKNDKYIGHFYRINDGKWTSSELLVIHADDNKFSNESLDIVKDEVRNYFV